MKVDSAMISDVPGYTWGTVSAMAQAGVKYFSIGPNYVDRIGRTMSTWEDKPFYWIGPDGKQKVLCWIPYMGYALGHTGYRLDQRVARATSRNWRRTDTPTTSCYLRWTVGGDNGQPDAELSDVVKNWNAKYAYPKMVIATTSKLFREFERRYGDKIPAFRGDFTPYWEDGAASSARETALNRTAAERLVQAETLWAMLDPGRYPADEFSDAWRNVILYDEHTWGAYNSINEPDVPFVKDQWKVKQAFALDGDAQSRELLAAALAETATTAQTRRRPSTCSTPPAGRGPIWSCCRRSRARAGDVVTDSSGQPVPSQRLSTGELAFLAKDVPPLAGRRFSIAAGKAATEGNAQAEGTTLRSPAVDRPARSGLGRDREPPQLRAIDAELCDAKSGIGLNRYYYVLGSDVKGATAVRPGEDHGQGIRPAGGLVAGRVRRARLREVQPRDSRDRRAGPRRHHQHARQEGRAREGRRAPGLRLQRARRRDANGHSLGGDAAGNRPIARRVQELVHRGPLGRRVERGVRRDLGHVGRPAGRGRRDHRQPDRLADQSQRLARQDWSRRRRFYSWVMNNHWHTNYRAEQSGPTTFRYALLPHKQYDPIAAQRFGIECSQPLVVVPARGAAPAAASVPRTRHAGRDRRLDQAERRRQGPDRASLRRRRQAGQGQPALGHARSKAVYRSNLAEDQGTPITGPDRRGSVGDRHVASRAEVRYRKRGRKTSQTVFFVLALAARPCRILLHRHALGQVPRLVDVAAAGHGDVIGQQLQRDHRDDRLQELLDGRESRSRRRPGRPTSRVALADDGDHRAAAGLDLLQVRHHLVVHLPVRHEEHAGRVLVDQGDRAVLHLGGRIALGVDVADFLELQRAFQGRGEVELPAEVEEVVALGVLLRDLAGRASLHSSAWRTLSGSSCSSLDDPHAGARSSGAAAGRNRGPASPAPCIAR